ncbi:MAG: hypothetical protein Q4P06_06720 [Actinomycetaceae bacterium]|nr:hypothetical protein [Actinomycetaceae bacterium]
MSWEITPVGSVLMVILVLAAIVVGVSLAPPKALPLDTGTAGKAVLQTSVTSVEKVEEYQRTEIPRVFILAGKEEVQLRTLALKRPTLLFYLSGACEPCSDLMKRLPEYQEKLPEVDFVGISGHDPKELDLPEGMRRYQDRNNVLKWLMRLSSPSALLLTPDGMISGGPVRSGRMIEEFISDIRAELDSVRQDA